MSRLRPGGPGPDPLGPDALVPRPRRPGPAERLLADDELLDAVRDGRCASDDDPVAQILAGLRDCATGACPCPARDRCVVRDTGRGRR